MDCLLFNKTKFSSIKKATVIKSKPTLEEAINQFMNFVANNRTEPPRPRRRPRTNYAITFEDLI
jgi:hypothetical protein